MSKYNVMVFPAGETNAIEIAQALSNQVNINLFGASSIERAGRFFFDNYVNDLPRIDSPIFLDSFNDLIKKWGIDIVIPTHDSVVLFLAENRADIKCQILAPELETAQICRKKSATYNLFSRSSFCPKVYHSESDLAELPVFVKPDEGQGSIGARRIEARSVEASNIDWENDVVCELLTGDEITVDCITLADGTLGGAFARMRNRVLGGVSVSGRSVATDPAIQEMASQINKQLKFKGMWYFQAKKSNDGVWKLLEISARGAGTQCLTRARGVNLPLLSVYSAMGRDVSVDEILPNIRMERILQPVYEFDYDVQSAYIDLDDTLIFGDNVNAELMKLLYQFQNRKIPLHLITRHETDPRKTLERLNIPVSLFQTVIHISDKSAKSGYITDQQAIFIDNSFVERLDVFEKLSIPVFDCEGVQSLLRIK